MTHAIPADAPPTRAEAVAVFRALVARHGLRWRADVPEEAHAQLARANTVLTADDRRAIAMGRVDV